MTTKSTSIDPHAAFSDQRLFTQPKTAIVRGELVKVAAIGNSEGHSPAYLCWDANGQSSIESLNDVTLIEAADMPPSVEQVQNVLAKLNEGTSGKGSAR